MEAAARPPVLGSQSHNTQAQSPTLLASIFSMCECLIGVTVDLEVATNVLCRSFICVPEEHLVIPSLTHNRRSNSLALEGFQQRQRLLPQQRVLSLHIKDCRVVSCRKLLLDRLGTLIHAPYHAPVTDVAQTLAFHSDRRSSVKVKVKVKPRVRAKPPMLSQCPQAL